MPRKRNIQVTEEMVAAANSAQNNRFFSELQIGLGVGNCTPEQFIEMMNSEEWIDSANEEIKCDLAMEQERKNKLIEMVKKNPYMLEHYDIDPDWKEYKQLVLIAIEQDPIFLRYANPKWREYKKLVIEAVEKNPYYLVYANPKWKEYKKLVVDAIEKNCRYLTYAKVEWEDYGEIVAKQFKKTDNVISFSGMRADPDKIAKCAKVNPTVLQYVKGDWSGFKELVIEAIKNGYDNANLLDPKWKEYNELKQMINENVYKNREKWKSEIIKRVDAEMAEKLNSLWYSAKEKQKAEDEKREKQLQEDDGEKK